MSAPSTTTQSSSQAGVPFHSTSHNYAEAQQTSSSPTSIKIPDGRRNSQGEMIPSPVESWKPNFARRQSWNREDLKREHVLGELVKKREEGMGTGFTEQGK
jgi:hypothetical protein